MVTFHLQIAGQVVAVTALFESTQYYCRAYLTQLPAAFSVAVTRKDLEAEQLRLHREALAEGLRPRVFPEPFLERSFIQQRIADHLLFHNILLFHGSAVAVDAEGYLFTAKCGTGKSTHTRLWRQVFADRAQMINDDKPFLQLLPEGVIAHGAPWSGKHGLDSNIAVPLKGICILERGCENRIQKATKEQSLFLHSQSHQPGDPNLLPQRNALTAALIERVSLWHMTCTKEEAAAVIAFHAMSPG